VVNLYENKYTRQNILLWDNSIDFNILKTFNMFSQIINIGFFKYMFRMYFLNVIYNVNITDIVNIIFFFVNINKSS